jgi:hypothetical protein
MLCQFLAGAALVGAASSAVAQTGGTAHLYAYRISDRAAFENGYRTHLRWHADHRDKLAWYAWYIVSGTRAGAFVDGTFGTTPEGLAGRPDPEGDGANFKNTAGPFVTAIGDEGWELVRRASAAAHLEARHPDNRINVYVIEPDDAASFDPVKEAKRLRAAAWYRSTADAPTRYLLIMPARSATEIPALDPRLPAKTVRAETWLYAPRLALIPRVRA